MSLAEIKVYDRQNLVFTGQIVEATEVGRRQPGEAPPFNMIKSAAGPRLIIAETEDNAISRRQLRIEPLPDGRFRVCNLSNSIALPLQSQPPIAPGQSFDSELPIVIIIGASKVIRLANHVELPDNSPSMVRLASPTLLPGQIKMNSDWWTRLGDSSNEINANENLLDWLQALMSVFQSAAGSEKFLADAAVATARIAKLDHAAVLLWQKNDWKLVTQHSSRPSLQSQWQPSRTILNEVLTSRSTVRQLPASGDALAHSLVSVESLVAAPILDGHGEVIGAIYGDRRSASLTGPSAITEVEARVVDLLACGVSTGLARMEQERVAVEARVRFEQFFTPELTRELELQPDLLAGRDAKVTLLFCDVRRFSSFSERLGPSGTFAWMNDVMHMLSECVIDNDGVLVDYIGDELIAMWGAPRPCPEQAMMATQAGIDAVRRLADLNRRWQDQLGEPMDFGIGINSGTARVGNTGSPRKFKYGPLGSCVNLASRVQSATKQVGVRFMVTGSTAAGLDPTIKRRRLCKVRVLNIDEPTELYEIADDECASWIAHLETFEQALTAFENDDCMTAIHLAGSLIKHLPNDGPTLLLLSRAIERSRNLNAPFDPIWTLDRK
jgi:adenylate cyclase